MFRLARLAIRRSNLAILLSLRSEKETYSRESSIVARALVKDLEEGLSRMV